MNAQEVISQVEKQGLTLATNDGNLIIQGTGNKQTKLTPELKNLLVEWKPKLIPLLSRSNNMKVINLVVDGKRITCLDPISQSDDEAIKSQQERWGNRLTYVGISCHE